MAASQAALTLSGDSMTSEIGVSTMKAIIVSTAYRLTSFMFSPIPELMVFLARMPRNAEETLESMAAKKPSQVNESSLRDARATPPTMGRSVAYVMGE